MKNIVKEKLKKGEVSMGTWLTIGHSTIAEILAMAGCEWIAIDMEHTSIGISDIEPIMQAIELGGASPMVRLSSNDPILAKRVMDIGAQGIIVPQVNSKEEAEMAVQSVKYAPEGFRGVGLYRAQGHGTHFDEYIKTANDNVLVIVQIENIRGVENIEEIVSVPGVDGIFIGPYDLSCSLGIPGQLDHPKVEEARAKVLEVAKKHNMILGSHVVPPDKAEVDLRKEQGYTFIAYSTDALVLNNHFGEFLEEAKKA